MPPCLAWPACHPVQAASPASSPPLRLLKSRPSPCTAKLQCQDNVVSTGDLKSFDFSSLVKLNLQKCSKDDDCERWHRPGARRAAGLTGRRHAGAMQPAHPQRPSCMASASLWPFPGRTRKLPFNSPCMVGPCPASAPLPAGCDKHCVGVGPVKGCLPCVPPKLGSCQTSDDCCFSDQCQNKSCCRSNGSPCTPGVNVTLPFAPGLFCCSGKDQQSAPDSWTGIIRNSLSHGETPCCLLRC